MQYIYVCFIIILNTRWYIYIYTLCVHVENTDSWRYLPIIFYLNQPSIRYIKNTDDLLVPLHFLTLYIVSLLSLLYFICIMFLYMFLSIYLSIFMYLSLYNVYTQYIPSNFIWYDILSSMHRIIISYLWYFGTLSFFVFCFYITSLLYSILIFLPSVILFFFIILLSLLFSLFSSLSLLFIYYLFFFLIFVIFIFKTCVLYLWFHALFINVFIIIVIITLCFFCTFCVLLIICNNFQFN